MFLVGAQFWAQKETPFQKRCLFFRRFVGNACLAVFVFLIQHWINGLILSEKNQVSWARFCKVFPEMRYTVQSDIGSAPRDK